MVRLLIISDSAVDRTLLKQALSKFPGLQVMDAVGDELELLSRLKQENTPDVVLIYKKNNLEKLSGIVQFLQQLYGARIIVSAPKRTYLPVEYPVDYFPKIELKIATPEFNRWLKELVEKIRGSSSAASFSDDGTKIEDTYLSIRKKSGMPIRRKIQFIAIGASTGGPQTLHKIFSGFPKSLNVPVAVVQHMPENFLPVLIEWLKSSSPLPVQIAKNGERPLNGHIYFAPDHAHLIIDSSGKFKLIDAPQRHNVKPSVSYLFESVANVYGDRALGILLTGMGKDGAAELALIKEKGGITIAQSKSSCVVFGMPKEAIRLNGATFILSPDEIVRKVKEIFSLRSATSNAETSR